MFAIDFTATVGTLEMAIKVPPAGGVTVVAGPNGAGKSSLLRFLLGALRPKTGSIQFEDDVLFRAGETDLLMEDRRLGYVPQRYALFPHLSVADNIGFGVRDKVARAERVRALLAELGIAKLAGRKCASLSGGESQRVALARALAIKPRALLLDEPMAALDPTTRREVRGLLRARLAEVSVPTLIVSHDLADAVALADRLVVIEAGRISQIGSLDEIRAAPKTEFVASFVAHTESRSRSS